MASQKMLLVCGWGGGKSDGIGVFLEKLASCKLIHHRLTQSKLNRLLTIEWE
jgi:hypothetical protein